MYDPDDTKITIKNDPAPRFTLPPAIRPKKRDAVVAVCVNIIWLIAEYLPLLLRQ